MRLEYLYHFDEPEVERILRAAEALVERCDLAPELRQAGFEKAVDMFANKISTGVEGSQIIPASMIRQQ